MIRSTLIYNPAAGQRDARHEVQAAIDYLTTRGWMIHYEETREPSGAWAPARAAALRGEDAVLVVGGDGSLSQAAAAVLHTTTAVGVLPVGTGNVWARQVGIPLNPLAAAQALADGIIRPIDVGDIVNGENHQVVVLWAGVGLDAAIAAQVESDRHRKRQWGILAYIVAGLAQAWHLRGTPLRVTMDGRTRWARVLWVEVCNIPLYAMFFTIAPTARLDDGLFDVYMFKGYSGLGMIGHLLRILAGHHRTSPIVSWAQARVVTIEGRHPFVVQVDGEPLGTTPMTIRVLPKALNVLLPRTVPSSLFISGGP